MVGGGLMKLVAYDLMIIYLNNKQYKQNHNINHLINRNYNNVNDIR